MYDGILKEVFDKLGLQESRRQHTSDMLIDIINGIRHTDTYMGSNTRHVDRAPKQDYVPGVTFTVQLGEQLGLLYDIAKMQLPSFISINWKCLKVTGEGNIKQFEEIAMPMLSDLSIKNQCAWEYYWCKDKITSSTAKELSSVGAIYSLAQLNNFNLDMYIRPRLEYLYLLPSNIPVYNEFHLEVDYITGSYKVKRPFELDWVRVNGARFPEFKSDLIMLEFLEQELSYLWETTLLDLEQMVLPEILNLNLSGSKVFRFIKCNGTWYLLDACDSKEGISRFLNTTRRE